MITKTKKKGHLLFVCLLTVLIVLAFTRYAFSINIPRMLLTFVVIAIALIGDKDEILAVSMCCIPLHNAIDFYIAMVACATIYVFKNHRHIKIGIPVIMIFVMIIWELLHCVSSDFNVKLFLVTVAPFIFIAVIISADIHDMDYTFIVRAMSVMCISVGIICLVNCIVRAGFNFTEAVANLRRLGSISDGDTLFGGGINPNTLGIVNALAITALLQLRFIGEHWKIDILCILLLVTFGVLTSSRTFLVCLFIMVFLFIIGQRGSIDKKIKFLIAVIIFAMIALIVLKLLFPEVLSYYIKRFQVEDITTGRDKIMVEYHKFIANSVSIMLFGVGLNNFGEKVTNVYNISNAVPHNSIQEIVVAWGIPGLIMIGILIVMMILESTKYGGKKTILNYIPLVIILAKSMAGQLLTSGYTMLALVFAYLSLCQNFSQSNNSKE